jgi:hypothetical protein
MGLTGDCQEGADLALPCDTAGDSAPNTGHAGDGKQCPLVPPSRCSPHLMRGIGLLYNATHEVHIVFIE